MPRISTASEPVTEFPYKFIMPFSDDAIVPLYSSINFVSSTQTECLPCVVCGNIVNRRDAISEQASRYKDYVPNEFSINNVKVGTI
jgi:hypothetical protein